MDTLPLLVCVLLCLAVVHCRNFEDRRDPSPLLDTEEQGQKHHASETRHRRRRWQTNYGYDYPPPMVPYYPERREYDRNQQDLLPKIVKLLEEISAYVKRPQLPPPPPQPIYIPYPVPYLVPQYISCAPTSNAKNPNVTSRFPQMEDTNQNWGFVLNEEDNTGPIRDFARPISFDPIPAVRPMKRPTPSVDHGSVQPDVRQTTQAPRFDIPGSARVADACNAGILACCAGDTEQQKKCFNSWVGCEQAYNDRTCDSDSINEALDAFRLAYSPMP